MSGVGTKSVRAQIYKYLLHTGEGRLLLGNTFASLKDGSCKLSEVLEYYRTSINLASRFVHSDNSVESFKNEFNQLRYSKAVCSPLPSKDPIVERCLHKTDILGSESAYVVTPLDTLNWIACDEDVERFSEYDLQLDIKYSSIEDLEEIFSDIDSDDMFVQMKPGAHLGRNLCWFTDSKTVSDIRSAALLNGTPKVQAFRNGLGLGHLEADVDLILLTLPGDRLDAAGHYRPVFCDGGVGSWFMHSSSAKAALSPLWGQTCDITKLHTGQTNFDGGFERVSFRPGYDTFKDAKIKFEYLGRVSEPANDTAAKTRLESEVWQRRKL